MDSLFDPEPLAQATAVPADAPLAVKMRPATLAEFVGQEHVLGEGSVLRESIEAGRPHSMIFYGPPGTGKTTLARIVATDSSAVFEELSAVQAGRAEVRAVIERARQRRATSERATVFFLDEIHRFNKAQQDALLPAVEEGLVTLIGATTENPFFEINSALISRTTIYELKPLSEDQLVTLLGRALEREFSGLGVDETLLRFIAGRADGDARLALSALELAVEVAGDEELQLEHAEDALQRRAIRYDQHGDQHHDFISAWIKSTRGSDVNASLYYLAVMLEAGEDPRFIARRMVILASEDISGADPQALQIATAAAAAVEHVGLPECQFTLSQAAIYLSAAPKSDVAKRAIGAARGHVREHGAQLPPDYLRSGSYRSAKELGRGQGYINPHRQDDGKSDQPLMPPGLEDEEFYRP